MLRRDHDVALGAAIALLDRAPGHRDALLALFAIFKARQQWELASIVVGRLAHVYLNDAVARATAVQYFLERGDNLHALFHGRILVRLAPEAVITHFMMGRAFLGVQNAKAAEHHFKVALRLPVPNGPEISARDIEASLATAIRQQGRFEEARAIFTRLAERADCDTAVLLAWADLEEAARGFDQASMLLDRAELMSPGNPQIALARAMLFRRLKEPARALEVLDSQAESGEGVAGGLLLQRGQALDAMGRYDEAFEAFTAYKQLLRERSGHGYQAEAAAGMSDALRGFFTRARDHLFPRAPLREDSPQPIFILGFPRSGTTLVEQTLSAHPAIAAGDELPVVHNLVERMPNLLGSLLAYPQALSELWLGDRVGHVETLRDLYLNEAARFGAVDPAKRWFTDKMPLNETHLGLISLMFPRSPAIHLVRHPLDVVLSVFSNALTHGYRCAYALESAARHYVLTADLVSHYLASLPVHYHAVRYEELVTDQERVVRGMLDFIGEPFDENTLAFHANTRPARTASYAQVTERLYATSRYRYRNYLSHLEPVIPILAPTIERLGYRIDA